MMRDAANFEPVDSRVTHPAFWNALPERWTSDVEERWCAATCGRKRMT